MVIKQKELEASKLKRQENTLKRDNSFQPITAEQRAIAHSKQSAIHSKDTRDTINTRDTKNTPRNKSNVETNHHQKPVFNTNSDNQSSLNNSSSVPDNRLSRKVFSMNNSDAKNVSNVNMSYRSTSNLKLQKNTIHKIHRSYEQKVFSQNTESPLQKPDDGNKLFSQTSDKFKKATETNFTKESDISNNKFKQSKIMSTVSTASTEFRNATTQTVKNGVKKYKNELERGDLGVKVAGQSLAASNKTIKFSRQKFKALKNHRDNKVIRQSNISAIKNLNAEIRTTKSEIKQIQRYRLAKRNRELGQAKSELKIKRAQLKSQNFALKNKKVSVNKNFFKKATLTPISNTVSKGGKAFQKNLERDDTGVEVTSKGATLVKQSVVNLNKSKKLLKDSKKVQIAKQNKLNTKVHKLQKKGSTLQKASANKLQKKAIKKQLASRNRNKLVGKVAGVVGNANTAIANMFKNFSFAAIKKAVLGKIAVAAGGSMSAFLPVFLVLGLFLIIIAMFAAGGHQQQQIQGTIGVAQNLSPEVEKWRDLVTTEANAQGMGDYVDLILAIIQVESGGRGPDIMQSSESAGYPRNYFKTELESVRQGISYLKSIVTILQSFNKGYENNARLIAQSYNFGSPFANYVGNLGGDYDLQVAENYSLNVVAPSLGNSSGTKYSYVNAVSQSFNKPYLYRNGGNFFYGELVGQYLGRPSNIAGDFASVLAEVEKYSGSAYVWGGKSPSAGFDCSGLVAWGLKQVGISLPSPASNQYAMTVPISPSEAQPGDLIFFKGTYGGPNHVSHVGFYIDENTMYDANGSGVGYHNWKSSYWQKHKPEIRRVVQ